MKKNDIYWVNEVYFNKDAKLMQTIIYKYNNEMDKLSARSKVAITLDLSKVYYLDKEMNVVGKKDFD